MTNITLSAARLRKVADQVDYRVSITAHFATAEAARDTPSALRHPYSSERWASTLTQEQRSAHLRQVIHEDETEKALASMRRRLARDMAAKIAPPTPPPAPVPEPVAEPEQRAHLAGYFVPCACGCGALVPARSYRPAHRWHNASAQAEAQRENTRKVQRKAGRRAAS